MIGPIGTIWQWHSTQGTTCADNRDACGIFETDAYTFAIVMDASPRGERGARFNACWLTRILDGMGPDTPSPASIISTLHDAQRHLRTERFFIEKAAYIAFLLPRTAPTAYAFCCGDCTLGRRSQDGSVEWLTHPHTLASALGALGMETDTMDRHTITRTLSARRFHTPDVHEISTQAAGSWVLATDGYRYLEADDAGDPKDDCSFLLIGERPAIDTTACPANLIVRQAPHASWPTSATSM